MLMSLLKRYKIGIRKSKRVTVGDEKKLQYYTSCNCGKREIIGYDLNYQERNANRTCSCGNKKFIDMDGEKRVLTPYLEVLKKDRRGFKAKRTNLSVFLDDEGNIQLKQNMVRIVIYDMPTKTIKVYKNGEPNSHTKWNSGDFARFFTGINESDFLDLVSTEETSTLFRFAWNRLSNPPNGYVNRLHLGFERLFDYQYMQILSSAGIPNVERFYERANRWTTYYSINKDGTSPKDILKVPKFVLKYIRENDSFSLYDLERVQNALKKVDGNRFRELLEIVKDESDIGSLCQCLDKLVEIHDTYNYNNIKKLTLYLFREIRMNQGISRPSDGATYLRDYIRMSEKLGLDYEKYPRSLKKEHDIVQMNYRVQENEKKKAEFAEAVKDEDYQFLNYKKKNFAIITPTEMDDLIREGNQLSHCVASYVTDIVSRRCKILFLRNPNDIKAPLATIEVRGGNVRQARGYANRSLTSVEKAFVKEWAKSKELNENYY